MVKHPRIITGTLSAVILAGIATPAVAATSGTTTVNDTRNQQYSHTSNPREFYNIYTENGGSYSDTLRLTEQNNVFEPKFTVLRSSAPANGWVYPNIGQGGERGMRPANTWNPTKVPRDGDPRASVNTTVKWPGNWNAGFDMWTEPANDPSGSDQSHGGTEVMVWTAAARNGQEFRQAASGTKVRPAFIDGKWWNVTDGWTSLNGYRWRRIFFDAQQPVQKFSGQLNPFLGAAAAYGMVSTSDYLTGIQYGFEINHGGGVGLAVNNLQITGVKDNTPQTGFWQYKIWQP